jgi:S1-C subfamily serine protease
MKKQEKPMMSKFCNVVLIILIVSIFFIAGCNTVPKLPPQVDMIDKAMQSVVAVYHPNIDVPASGFYIGNGVIVTAGHVASVENLEKVVFEDGLECSIIKQIAHKNYDCGFLLIENIDKPVLNFDLADVKRGEIIFVLGNPNGLVFNVSKGIISSSNRLCNGFFGETVLIGYDAATERGSSGSPVIDEDGEVRGINVGNNGFHGSAVAITVSDIIKAMKEAKL